MEKNRVEPFSDCVFSSKVIRRQNLWFFEKAASILDTMRGLQPYWEAATDHSHWDNVKARLSAPIQW